MYFSTVNWLTTADEIYKFLTESFDAYNLMIQNLQINEPEAYENIENKISENIYVYFEDYEGMGSVSKAYDDKTIHLTTGESFCHEIVHLWVSNNDPNNVWLSEGLANVISMPGSAKYISALQKTYEIISQDQISLQLGAADRDFMNRVKQYYLAAGKSLESEDKVDYAFIYNAIGTVLLVPPKCNTTLSMANISIAETAGLSKQEGGNLLSYPEAYALVQYMADVYGMDTIINVVSGKYSFNETFKKDFQAILQEYVAQMK